MTNIDKLILQILQMVKDKDMTPQEANELVQNFINLLQLN